MMGEEAIEGVDEGDGTTIAEGTNEGGPSGAGAYVASFAGGLFSGANDSAKKTNLTKKPGQFTGGSPRP